MPPLLPAGHPLRTVPRSGSAAAVRSRALITADGVRLDAAYDPPHRPGAGLCFVLGHGFTGSWRRAPVRAIAGELRAYGGVVSLDFRGHGRSGGRTTVGDREVLDLDAALAWARALGHSRVVTVGWSMGGAVAVRHAALHGGVDAVVSVSAPARWYYRDTAPMRRVHYVLERPLGRLVARHVLRTRVATDGWDPLPASPTEAAARVSPTPLLVVHGEDDGYFPPEHARALYDAAGEPRELWLVPGFGHAEAAADPLLVRRIGAWARAQVRAPTVSGASG